MAARLTPVNETHPTGICEVGALHADLDPPESRMLELDVPHESACFNEHMRRHWWRRGRYIGGRQG